LFDVERVDADRYASLAKTAKPAPDPGTPLEIAFASDDLYEVYLNGAKVFQHRGWGESPFVTLYTTKNENLIAVKTPSNIVHPGFIGKITVGNRTVVTRPEDWTAVYCPKEPTAAWLNNAGEGPGDSSAPRDLGGFGTAPWNYVPGHFAGIDARWIWPAGTPSGDDQACCLFRTVVQLGPRG
jgi:hypothetical protein